MNRSVVKTCCNKILFQLYISSLYFIKQGPVESVTENIFSDYNTLKLGLFKFTNIYMLVVLVIHGFIVVAPNYITVILHSSMRLYHIFNLYMNTRK